VNYQLRIAQPLTGETEDETAARLSGETDAEEIAPDPFEIRRIGQVLETAVPRLQRSDAPKGWMLTHPGSGAQIRMSGDEFGITAPPTFSAATARTTWTDLMEVLRTLRNEGYVAYDPQLGRILDPDEDLQAVLSAYVGSQQTQTPAATAVKAESKPWWKVW
jgi:hypothetical protein